MLLIAALLLGSVSLPAPTPAERLDTAIARMGGEAALRRIERPRFEAMTQWLRTSFDGRPFADALSYESHSDLRDYTRMGWRNTRRFLPAAPGQETVDVVVDTVAIRGSGGLFAPLNAAYVDDRAEIFAFAPERLLLAARAAGDLRALRDTTVGGVAYVRVAATVERFPAVIWLRRDDGMLAAAHFRAAQPRDFGLTAWGTMPVEIWYSRWRPQPSGVRYPTQLDVKRVGQPYKRITYLTVALDTPAAPDSFAVSDSLRRAFVATATRAMFDLAPDSARIVAERFAEFRTNGYPVGAVKLGSQWLLLEGGIAPLSAERALAWLERQGGGGRATDAVLTSSTTPSAGGSVRLAVSGVRLWAPTGAAAFAREVVAAQGGRATVQAVPAAGRWLRLDADSAWVEPMDLPDLPGSALVYVPSQQWLYAYAAASPVVREVVLARAKARGWSVAWLGTARDVHAKLGG
jgi:hypothetical protein